MSGDCPEGYTGEQLAEISANDDYTRGKAAEESGRAAFAGDLARRFDFDRQPRNPFQRSDFRHECWERGISDARSEWFNV